MVVANMKHQPMRSLLSALLIGVPVTLILTLVGLSHGMLEDAADRTRGIGADIIVRPKGSTLLSMRNGIPEAYVAYFAKEPHVVGAVGSLTQQVEGITMGMNGLDIAAYNAMTGGFKYVAGGPPPAPDGIVIDEYYAREKNARVGSRLRILNRWWRVSGIIRNGQMSHLVVNLKTLQDILASNGDINSIFLKLDNPANTAIVKKELLADPKLGRSGPFIPPKNSPPCGTPATCPASARLLTWLWASAS